MPRIRTQEYRCGVCGQGFSSQQGLRAHVRLSPGCREVIQARNQLRETTTLTSPPPNHNTFPDIGQDTPPEIDISHPPSSLTSVDADRPEADPRRARVEDADDEDEDGRVAGGENRYWLWDFPDGLAGGIIEGSVLAHIGSRFENIRHRQRLAGKAPWDPFLDDEEWEVAQWLVETGVSQRNIDRLLKLKKVIYLSLRHTP